MTDNRLLGTHRRVLRGARFVCADCGFVMGDLRVAANFRKLRKEQYFQTSEGRAALEMVERRYPHDKRVTPWLLREYRRGRLVVTPHWQRDVDGLMQAEKEGSQEHVNYFNERLDGDRPDIVFFEKPEDDLDEDERMRAMERGEEVPQPTPIQPGMVQNIVQMLDYFDKRHKPIDIMNKSIEELKPQYESWKSTYRSVDPDAGQVVHTYPNDWTMRRITGRDELFNEGEEMQNCVPKYVDQVAQGTHHLFSLRDRSNNPHTNVLMVPPNQGDDWRNGGSVVDIRGKQNATPVPEYQRYVRDWFNTLGVKPTAEFAPGPPGDPGAGHPEDYGLDTYHYGKLERKGWQLIGDYCAPDVKVASIEWRDITASFITEANMFNKVRNMMRKNNQFTPENEAILEHLRYAYPNHDKLAEWLHREVRKERLSSPVKGAIEQVQRYKDAAAQYQGTAREYRETDPATADSYLRRAETYLDEAATAAVQLRDPEWLEEQRLVHNDPETGRHTTIDPETLDAIQEVHKKRKQRGNAETNLMKIPIADLLEEAREEAMAKKARDTGSTVFKTKDGWEIRHLDTANDATVESEMLGHCIGQYGDKIERGESHNYSLRDPKGLAHVTLEIKHNKPATTDWNSLREAMQGQDFECPSCKSPVINGKCTNHDCLFNLKDMQDYHEGDELKKDEIKNRLREEKEKMQDTGEGKATKYPQGDPRNDECPACGSRYKCFINNQPWNDPDRWKCRQCGNLYDSSSPLWEWPDGEDHRGEVAGGQPTFDEGDNWVRDGNYWDNNWYEEERGSPANPNPESWWGKLSPQLQANGLLKHDYREGDAYQIQGKENKAPEPKYHRYIKEWLRSMPYDERPKATWSSYFTKTPVLHVNDLELGGEKGEDDFGFQWRDRPYDWKSITNSLHGKPKQWAEPGGTQKKFQEEKTPDENTPYVPELGERLYNFAKDSGNLDEVMQQIGPWGVPESAPFRNLGELPCAACGQKGYLHRDPNNPQSTYCSYCGEKQETASYEDKLAPTPEPRAQYESPYQAQMVQHLGPMLAEHPEIQENLDQWIPQAGTGGIKTRGVCPRCGTSDYTEHGAEVYCNYCGRYYTKEDFRLASTADTPQLHVGFHGQPCYCGWNVAQRRHAAAFKKVADKFNDYLMNPQSRPDLQDEQSQQFLQSLQDRYLNPETDEMMPWLVREWKKGRVHNPEQGLIQYTGPEDYEYEGPNGEPTRTHGLSPGELNHWAQWYRSDHPTRRGVDIMQMGTPEMTQKIKDWEEDLKKNADGAATTKGKVEYEYPDGWSVQNLQKESQLKDEGEKMGHCVGGYFPNIQQGRSMIYSLRDHQNEPHATWEITPRQYQCKSCGDRVSEPLDTCSNNCFAYPGPDGNDQNRFGDNEAVPHGGTMVQIQGKGNEAPIEDYQKRLKEYFTTKFPNEKDRPTWDDQYVNDPDDLDDEYREYHPGDYGLNEPNVHYDWDQMVEDLDPDRYTPGHWHDGSNVVDAAEQAGPEELKNLSEVVDRKYNEAKDQYLEGMRDHIAMHPEAFEHYLDLPEEPNRADYPDEDSFNEAWEDWDHTRSEKASEGADEAAEDSWSDSNEGNYWDTLDSDVSNALFRANREQKTGAWHTSRRTPHQHWSTGQWCNCTFTKHLPRGKVGTHQVWSTKVIKCQTCGDPLEGGKCQRCDWGGWYHMQNDKDPAHDNPTDVTQDLKPAIQAKQAALQLLANDADPAVED